MIQQIRNNVFVVTENLGSNNTAIVTSRGVVLFDTPHKPTDAMRWRKFTDSLGPLRWLVLSDHHIDHSLTNAFFGGTLIAHEKTREKLKEHHPSMEFIDDLLQTIDPEGIRYVHGDFQYRLPDVTVNQDMTLWEGNTEIRLLHRKGHTENSLMLYLPREKVLLTGDNVCEVSLPCTDQTCFPEVYETLDFIINDLDVETIVPGHGDVCTKKEAIRFKGWLRDIESSVRSMMEKGAAREEVSAALRFVDLIHCDTSAYKGYPPSQIEGFRKRSYEHIYDCLLKSMR